MSDDETFEPEALEVEEAPASEEEGHSSEADPEDLELQDDGQEEGEGEETQEDEEADDNDGDDEDSPELVDFEVKGKAYKVHPDLVRHLMLDADYTQKRQAGAEKERELIAREQSLTEQAEAQKALIGDYAQLQNINNQLAQYKNFDWQKAEAEDPFSPQRHMLRIQELKDAQQQLAAGIQQKEHQRTVETQQETAKREQEFQMSLHQEIPGWGHEMGVQLTTFAANTYGVTPDELSTIKDVRFVKMVKDLKEAHELKARLQKQQQAAKKPKPKPEAKPLTNPPAKGRAKVKKGLSDDMKTGDWMKQRQKQVAARSRY